MSDQWHYRRDGKQAGPVSVDELMRLASLGRLSPDDLVWRPGMPEWVPAARFKAFFTNIASKPAPVEELLEVIPVPELPEVIPVEEEEFSPLRHTTIVRHSFIKALFMAPFAMLFGLIFIALAIYSLPNCCGWFSLLAGIVLPIFSVFEGAKLFQRGPVLIIDRRGFTDNHTEDGKPLFLPWNEIVGAGSFRFRVNLGTVSDTVTIHCRKNAMATVTKVKVDTVGLTMSGADVANEIKRHLRALGR